MTALWLLGRVPAAALPWPLLRLGRAGRGAGLDVREALFRSPHGVLLAGALEVHRRASDWERHGHARDPAYAGVVLHLVWEDDAGGSVPLAGGGRAPTVALGPVLGYDRARWRRYVQKAGAAYGDGALARATATLAANWSGPRPYGRTRALAAALGAPRGGGALWAQGLLHLQELWCERGGCGVCLLSPPSTPAVEDRG
ncbi:MAG: DUF2851 family protein [Dehalococcoidia bacterium]|nr:DUF2851 family protein [Dehalococcoidia bacterium]